MLLSLLLTLMLIIHTGLLLLIKSAASPFDLTEAKVPKHLKLIKTKQKKKGPE